MTNFESKTPLEKDEKAIVIARYQVFTKNCTTLLGTDDLELVWGEFWRNKRVISLRKEGRRKGGGGRTVRVLVRWNLP